MGPVLRQSLHLAARFFGSLKPGPPAPEDEAWARAQLGSGEAELWVRLSNPDRRHAVGVAREVVRRWPEVGADTAAPPRPVVAAALLHDVGKVDSQLRTPARVVATLVWSVLDDDRARRWADGRRPGIRSRLGRYRRHPEIGGQLLRRAGADPLTASWAEEHHRSSARWTVPEPVGELLKACDDD